jgi:predicted  nucleic acid-binding Zn-ribbon protein
LREEIQVLTSLQSVDQRIEALESTRLGLLSELKGLSQKLEDKKTELGALKALLKEKEADRARMEKEVQEESKKLRERRTKLSRIRNLRELQSLQREMEQTKQNNAKMEEELLTLMEDMEGKGTLLKQEEARLREEESAWQERKKSVEKEIESLEKEHQDHSRARTEIVARLSEELVHQYQLIFSRRGGKAVVSVGGGTCQGCYVNIPPQLYNEIMENKRLILCPNCHRILYIGEKETKKN